MASLSVGNSQQLLAIFLVQFDVHKGNTIVWSHKDPAVEIDFEKDGLEFKAMPAGLHDRTGDVITFSTMDGKSGVLYQGISVFRRSKGRVLVSGIDRKSLSMYSLAILLSPAGPGDDNRYWVYTKDMDILLCEFIESLEAKNGLILDENRFAFQKFHNFYKAHGQLSLIDPSVNHPLHDTIEFFKTYGPNIFPLWRACILRKRVLLVDAGKNAVSLESMGNYVYIMSLLSSIPKDVFELIPHVYEKNIPVTSLYNVTLVDMETLESAESYIASTTDGIIAEKSQLYDIAAVITDCGQCELYEPIISSSFKDSTVKARFTHNDSVRYEFLRRALKIQDASPASAFEIGNPYLNRLRTVFNDDTAYGLLWWASAGSPAMVELENEPEGLRLIENWTISDSESDDEDDLPESGEGVSYTGASESANQDSDASYCSSSRRHRISTPVILVGYFHHLTRKLMSTVGNLIRIQNQATILTHEPDYALSTLLSQQTLQPIVIDPTDMTRMGLDPLSSHDRLFLVNFVTTWFGRRATINTISLSSCCCI